MCKFWIILLFCIVVHVSTCSGSAWLQDPPSRSAAWYYQIKTPVNYNFRNLDCGGVPVRINADGSRNCGLCGDPYTDPIPRENELGGKYADPRVRTRYYESGQVAELSIWNNLPGAPGFYEIRMCDEDYNQTQACLDKHLLTIQETGKTYMPVPKTQGLVVVHVELPPGVTCDYCLLQWRFRKESLAGCDDENWCGVGRGAQIEFYNCADVMIGAVGQPKPSFIQDPIYQAADYGSAYDVATTRTTPDGSKLIGTTSTPTTTNGVPIITIPTAFPTGTTNNPATSGTTDKPASTSGTTNSPVTTNSPITINTPGTTVAATTGPVPTRSRLVVDANGNAIAGQSVNGRGSNVNNRYLLTLLSLIPLVGAIGLQNGRSSGVAPLLPVPPSAPVTWAAALPVTSPIIEDTFGFGNFRAGNTALIGTGGYFGNNGNEAYKSKHGYNTRYIVSNAGTTNLNNFGLNKRDFSTLGTKTGKVPINIYNTKTYPTNNVGTQFVQNPAVWTNNGVSINSGVSHVFPRSVSFQNGTPYKPSPSQYSNPSGIAPHQVPNNEYGSNPQPGYTPHGNIPHLQNSSPQIRPEVQWPRNTVQGVNSWQNNGNGPGTRNWQTGVNNAGNTWQNNGRSGQVNRVNINAVSTGQRLPVPETVTQRMRIVTPAISKTDNSFNLPGIESASRFQVKSPRKVTELSKPGGSVFSISNGVKIQNGIGGGTTSRTDMQNNFDPSILNTRAYRVNDWYNMLFRRFSVSPSRPL